MKILLLQDVAKLGRKGGLVDVSDAYARNFILPKKLGVIATTKHQAQAAQAAQQAIATQVKTAAKTADMRQRIEGAGLHIAGHANPQGKLFAAIRAQDILVAAKQAGIDLHGCTFEPNQLKQLGVQQLSIRWPDQVTSSVTITVTNG